MKIQLFISIIFAVSISVSVNAQYIEVRNDSVILATLKFDSNFDNKFSFKAPMEKNESRFLIITGYLLEGFKYPSVIDRFYAKSPLDILGFQPINYSSYVSYLDDMRLLKQQITLAK